MLCSSDEAYGRISGGERMNTKFIPKRVTIQPICKDKHCRNWAGYGYFYGDECFAYVWAFSPFSKAWWSNLLFVANRSPQDCLKFGEDLKRKRHT